MATYVNDNGGWFETDTPIEEPPAGFKAADEKQAGKARAAGLKKIIDSFKADA